ncbi:aspartate carbamoyltransferase [Noviherbaspirillum galbum]|uniref:Aspartate carbamoyltransferase n=1 Tax=Noviherbaspirillum galbum TaxID=2709383 RepID=A0A6B3SUE9_9BURK|nr:aspartate carbamoyltransferase [Noviherbaspirillum galbum]NEX64640.1 aspartate carbamoyltransferase [Noviherbaspirillum galbum]
MRKSGAIPLALSALIGVSHAQNPDPSRVEHGGMDHAAHMKMMDAQRQAEVAERGKDVMPFSLPATTHVFTKNAEGGVQRVVAKSSTDASQVKLVRQHLREIREQFLKGDFSGPAHIHGQDMPGLAELRKARPGQIDIVYQDVKGGAQLIYRTKEASLVTALHQWFDAQLSDHGKDAVHGHGSHSGS